MSFTEKTIAKNRTLLIMCTVAFLPLLFFSCGAGTIGYGVILMSPDQQDLQTGTVVRILKESDIHDTYTVEATDGGEYELDRWRISIFKEQSSAENYARAYTEYVPLYARNLRDGLAVREEPDITSNRVYKMRLGQEIKILRKTNVSEQIGDHQGYWYQVLTKDGIRGYCFDAYLEIFDITAQVEKPEGPDITPLTDALQKTYRPETFRNMIDSGQIFLDRFTREYGLFTNLEENRVQIRLFENSYSFTYSEIRPVSTSRYQLAPTGLEIILRGENTVQVVFTVNDKTYDPVFIYLDDEKIEEVRSQEMERRAELMETLISNGPLYTSSAYGSIRFLEGGGFTWERLDRLVPSIIPGTDFSEGRVTFDHFISPKLNSPYDGVLALRFQQAPAKPVLFLYDLENSSLKLEYVPERSVENRVVQQSSGSPLIMAFFRQQ